MPYAVLTGTRTRLRLEIHIPATREHETLAAALEAARGIERDPDTGHLVAAAPTGTLIDKLRARGIVVDALEVPETIAALRSPQVQDTGDGHVLVYPGLARRADIAFDLGDDARFDPETGAFRAPTSAVDDWPAHLVPASLRTHSPGPDAAPGREGAAAPARPGQQLDIAPGFARIPNPTTVEDAARNASAAAGPDGYEREIDILTRAHGDVPEHFGMAPYPYQRVGALCVAAGRRLLADVPGLGKSIQAILTGALLGSRRWIIACPPVVQSNWAREIERCGVLEMLGDGASIAMIRPGRKVPALPAAGIVIVTDSLLAATTRSDLLADLMDWSADLLVYDEAHRAKTWETARSRAMRKLAATATDRIALTGTPIMSNPSDLAPVLAITGQLETVFGSRAAFMARYTRSYMVDIAGRTVEKVVPRKENLPELNRILREQIWVRRTKDQVLADLPEKDRQTMLVDVAATEYRKAAYDVRARIADYLRQRTAELGRPPEEDEVRAWCAEQMGCVSLMRRATGLAKVPAAAEYITDWIQATGTGPDGGFDRPLIAWGIHQEVIDRLAEHLDQADIPHAVINGGTSMAHRDRIVEDYQAGRIAVILANIVAAGVGITLTRGSDALVVETEWLPDLISQAEDRQHRIGQARHVTVTTMVARGTLDHTIQAVLRRNIATLDAVIGGTGHQVSVDEADMESLGIGDAMWELAEPLLRKCRKASRSRAAA